MAPTEKQQLSLQTAPRVGVMAIPVLEMRHLRLRMNRNTGGLSLTPKPGLLPLP